MPPPAMVNDFRERENFYRELDTYRDSRSTAHHELQEAILSTEALARNATGLPDEPLIGDLAVLQDAADRIMEKNGQKIADANAFNEWLHDQAQNMPPGLPATVTLRDPGQPDRLVYNSLQGTHWYAGHSSGDPIWLCTLSEVGGNDSHTQLNPWTVRKGNHEFTYCGEVPRPASDYQQRLEACLPAIWGLVMTLLECRAMALCGLPLRDILCLHPCLNREIPFRWDLVGEFWCLWCSYFDGGCVFPDTKALLQRNSMLQEVAWLIEKCKPQETPEVRVQMDNFLSILRDCTGSLNNSLVERHEENLLHRAKASFFYSGDRMRSEANETKLLFINSETGLEVAVRPALFHSLDSSVALRAAKATIGR